MLQLSHCRHLKRSAMAWILCYFVFADFFAVGLDLVRVFPADLPALFAAVPVVVRRVVLLAVFEAVLRAVFLTGVLPRFGAGPLAAFSAISVSACSSVTLSGFTVGGRRELIAPHLTYGPELPDIKTTGWLSWGVRTTSRSGTGGARGDRAT